METRSILFSKSNLNLPNILSLVRILAVGILIYFFTQGMRIAAFITYVLASATDALDGYIARKYDLITPLGKLLDPLADKMMLITVLACMFFTGLLPLWVLIVMLVKEVAQVVGGFLLLRNKNTVVQANIFGKLTTVFFSVSVILLFWHEYVAPFDNYALIFTVIFAVFALVQYAVKYINAPNKSEDVVDQQAD